MFSYKIDAEQLAEALRFIIRTDSKPPALIYGLDNTDAKRKNNKSNKPPPQRRRRRGHRYQYNTTTAVAAKNKNHHSSSTNKNVHDLPNDIIYLIAQHLSPSDQVCLGLTCKQLHASVLDLRHGGDSRAKRLTDLTSALQVHHPMSGRILYPEREALIERLKEWVPQGYVICGQCGQAFCKTVVSGWAIRWCGRCDRHRDEEKASISSGGGGRKVMVPKFNRVRAPFFNVA